MPDTHQSPGQRAYEAYWPGLTQHSPYLVSDPPVAWDALPTGVQAAWEAAAQAVRVHQQEEEPQCTTPIA